MSTDSEPTPEYSPLGRARDDLEARQRQVALLELPADRGIQIREASIEADSDTDGTPVYLDVVVPADGLQDVVDPIPSAEERIDDLDQPLEDATADSLDDDHSSEDTALDAPTDEDVEEPEYDDPDVDDDSEVDDEDDESGETLTEIVAEILDVVGCQEKNPLANWTRDTRETVAVELEISAADAQTKDDVVSSVHEALDLEGPQYGSPMKGHAISIRDALQADTDTGTEDPETAEDPTVASGEDADTTSSDTTESAEPATEDLDERDAPASTMHAPKEVILQEVCLALGVAPPESNSGTVTHRVARDIAAKLDDRDPESLQLKDRSALFDIIGNTVRLGDWRGRKPDLEAIHDRVVPEAHQSGEMTFEEIAAEANIPAWMDEASFHVAAGDAESLRELAHDIGWESDLDDLRRITFLAGAYDGLPEPEAKQDSKYAVAGGGM